MSQSFSKSVPIDTDINLAADSNLLVPSQKAVKAYVDNNIINGAITSITVNSPLTGGTITTTGTIGIPQASLTTDGYITAADYANFSNVSVGVTKGFVIAMATAL